MPFKEDAALLKTKLAETKKFWDDLGETDPNEEQKQQIDTLNKEVEELGVKVTEAKEYQDVRTRQQTMESMLSEPVDRPVFPNGDARDRHQPVPQKSLGREFVEAAEFKDWFGSINPTGGAISDGLKIHSPAVESKALVLSSATSGGALVRRDYGPTVDFPLRGLTIRDVISVGQTGSNLIEFVRVTAKTRAAAVTPEATDTTGGGYTAAAKPEAGMTLQIVQEGVKTIPAWMPITRNVLADAPQLQSMIDNFLQEDVELALEDQIISGTGGSNFTGLENTAGITPQAFATDMITTARKALTKVKTVGRANATAFLLNPYDWEALDLTTATGSGVFYFGGPTTMGIKTLWGKPVVESEVIPQGTGYTGDLRQMMLWDRERGTIRVTDSHADFFTHNIIAILCELRAAFGILRPSAIVKLDLHAGANS